MEPLIFKIETQADDSGVRQYDKSLGGLDVSSKKASGALKSFSHELLQAKSGADVAAAGAESLSRVLEKSLAGAVVIGGIKIISDQINKMAEILRSVGEATGAAVTQLERMGEIKGIEDATRAITILEGTIDSTTKSLGLIKEGNWFTKITASITGTTEELKAQLKTQESIRDGLIAEGLLAEKLSTERNAGISEEQKLYDGVQTKLEQKLALANKIGNEALRQEAIQSASFIADIERTNLSIKLGEEQAKKEAEQADATQKNIDAQIKKEQELRAVQQKRFNDLYDAEVKSQEATQKRVDSNLKAEQDLADKQKGLKDELEAAKAAPIGGGGGGGGGGPSFGRGGGGAGKYNGSVPGLSSRGPGQRQTSAEVGANTAAQRASVQGQKDADAALRQYTSNQLKASGAASDSDAVTKELSRQFADNAYQQSRYADGTQAQLDKVHDLNNQIADLGRSNTEASKSAIDFSSSMSDVLPSFDNVTESANNLADSITENTGNMVGDFLKTGTQSSDLGKEFDKAATSVDDFSEKLKKAGAGGGGGKGGAENARGGGSLASIEKLLQKNFDELQKYVHAT